jgi:hypothetical protein
MARYFSLTLDDFAPDPRTGLNFESIHWCDRLIQEFPGFTVNLFVPAAYCRLGEKPHWLSENKEWVKRVNDLPNNYKINMHGLYHRRSKIDYKWHQKHESNNDEFEWISEGQANILIDRMINEFEDSGLRYVKTFRPPGWKISAGAATALTKHGFLIAGDDRYYDMLKDKVSGLKWVSKRWCLKAPLEKFDTVVAAGHTSNWAGDYFNEEMYNKVRNAMIEYNFTPVFLEKILYR